MDERVIRHDINDRVLAGLDCWLVGAVWDLRDAGAPPARIWEVVKDAIEQWDEER